MAVADDQIKAKAVIGSAGHIAVENHQVPLQVSVSSRVLHADIKRATYQGTPVSNQPPHPFLPTPATMQARPRAFANPIHQAPIRQAAQQQMLRDPRTNNGRQPLSACHPNQPNSDKNGSDTGNAGLMSKFAQRKAGTFF